jgi:hypothetical protein
MKRIFGIAILATLMACGQADKKSSEVQDSTVKDSTESKTSATLKDEKINVIFSKYEILKDALVKSDSLNAKKAAGDLQTNLATYKGCELTAEVANKIATTTNLAAQRKEFTVLSSDLIALLKTADVAAGTIYVQHCPMANKGDGGDWLSSAKEIRNPYYGDEMLECGRVAEEIKAK